MRYIKRPTKRESTEVDAVRLNYAMTIEHDGSGLHDSWIERGKAGDWLVTHPEGGQYFMTDKAFHEKFIL